MAKLRCVISMAIAIRHAKTIAMQASSPDRLGFGVPIPDWPVPGVSYGFEDDMAA